MSPTTEEVSNFLDAYADWLRLKLPEYYIQTNVGIIKKEFSSLKNCRQALLRMELFLSLFEIANTDAGHKKVFHYYQEILRDYLSSINDKES